MWPRWRGLFFVPLVWTVFFGVPGVGGFVPLVWTSFCRPGGWTVFSFGLIGVDLLARWRGRSLCVCGSRWCGPPDPLAWSFFCCVLSFPWVRWLFSLA